MRDIFQPFTEVIQQRFRSCAETLQLTDQEIRDRMQHTIQETEETNLENQQTIQEIGQTNQETNGDFQELSFIGHCAFLLVIVPSLIVGFPLEISFFLIGLAVRITLSVLLILGKLILVALRLLVSMLSRILAHRQEEVARLLYEFAKKDTNMGIPMDKDGNTILHLAAKLAPPYQLGCISGSAFQLQSELRWFKGVGEIVPRSYHKHKNKKRETPLEVFVGEHQDLLKEAEEWGKKTAESSTVVGALIITIMFSVAFTVPGGNDQSTGFPILSHKTPIPFMIFMVSDALSLFAASSSVIIFLGILTAHHAAEDYCKYSLVINGLTYLFISIATMTIAFCAALFITLQGRLVVVIPITLVAVIPIKWFVQLQFPLLVDIFCLTLGPNIFGSREASWMSRRTADMISLWLRGYRRFK
ncbi:hypothetical protein SLA2020_409090 [Shorea laevis]